MSSSASSRARRCSCSTAATRSACSPAPTCSRSSRPRRLSRDRRARAGDRGFETRAIHAGQEPDADHRRGRPADQPRDDVRAGRRSASTAATSTPRSGNPTRTALETCLASLEGARHGLAFASGLAAEDAVLRTLDPGDHVVIPTDAYGGTFRLVAEVHERHGRRVDRGRPRRRRPRSTPRGATRRAWCGSRRRPTRRCRSSTSPRSRSSRTRAARASSSTTRSPRRTSSSRSRSAPTSSCTRRTKYLGGHSDVVGGFVAVDDAELADEVRFLQNAMGAVPSPFDCYLVLRGVKTLAVRMDRHCDERARRSSQMLRAHDAVARVLYPGPRRATPATTSRPGRCATSAAWCRSSPRAARTPRSTSWRAPRLFTLAESLGAVESLIEHPGAHDPRVGRGLAARGRPARSSACRSGIETADDLVADLRQALDSVA